MIVREGFSFNILSFFSHSKDQSSELSSNPHVRVIFSFGKNSVQFGSAASFGLGVSEEGNKINVHFRCRTPKYSTIKNYDIKYLRECFRDLLLYTFFWARRHGILLNEVERKNCLPLT